ncbi:hypothetical protein LIER_31580 [Lithospermum erythrorhizon]|uniref:Uncharacterized protein n=1 Tax=Lithospermum erythrorhizon TaxID=34254 RepID=A0AAV3RVD9_LITER
MDKYSGIDFKFIKHLIPFLWDIRPYVYACPYLVGGKRAVGVPEPKTAIKIATSYPTLFPKPPLLPKEGWSSIIPSGLSGSEVFPLGNAWCEGSFSGRSLGFSSHTTPFW